MTDTPTSADWFAFCFSHGRMHWFRPSGEYPDGAWCTASWVRLDVATEDGAEAEKARRFGDARFVHQLPLETQVAIMDGRAAGVVSGNGETT